MKKVERALNIMNAKFVSNACDHVYIYMWIWIYIYITLPIQIYYLLKYRQK